MQNLRVYQIYFKNDQEQFLSRDFAPYFNKFNDEFYEAGVFRREFNRQSHLQSAYTGYVSWKFEQKSFVSAVDFLNLMVENPDCDVYFLNPFPEIVGKFRNVWIQGDSAHPGLLDLAQKTFKELGIKLDLRNLENDESNTLYCNYWYGSQKFWVEFMDFCRPFYELFEDKNSRYYREIRMPASYYFGGTMIPFFMERLFSTFLVLRPDIKKQPYVWTIERRLEVMLKMREKINRCDAALAEILTRESALPKWRRWLLRP
jgi:hypothetical protein